MNIFREGTASAVPEKTQKSRGLRSHPRLAQLQISRLHWHQSSAIVALLPILAISRNFPGWRHNPVHPQISRHASLLISQGHHGVDAYGAPRRNITSQQRDTDEHNGD